MIRHKAIGVWLKRVFYPGCIVTLLLTVFAACGGQSSTTSSTTSSAPKTPLKIGASLSLSGDFSDDGKAFQQGYQLWADYVNAHGGILGRQVQLDIVSDASSPSQVATNYQKLITVDKDDFVFGPYSTLLTKPSSVVANRYGYAMLEGAGGGPSVFTQGLNNVFDVSLPVIKSLASFVQYIVSLPPSQRPKTAAYATEDDPFTQPQVDLARQTLEQAGVHTAYYTVYPAETTDYTPIAQKVIQSNAQIDVLGTMMPDIVAFIQAFRQQHYNPQAVVATAGPDQGASFLKAVGGANVAEGVMVPNSWYPTANNYQNAEMVKDYIAKYGGTPSDISADTAEAYSVGQVFQQAIEKIHSFDNKALIQELHSGDTFNSVQGPVKFDSTGQNVAAQAYLFQWRQGTYTVVYPGSAATSAPEFPKTPWP